MHSASISVWDSDGVLNYVRALVHNALGKKITDDADIFDQANIPENRAAIRVRDSLICGILQTHKDAAGHISQQFLYETRTIANIAEKLLRIVHAISENPDDNYSLRLQHVERVISEFSSGFPEHRPTEFQSIHSGEVILLTGTTGALESHLLAYLASVPQVSHVYALNRRGGDGKSLRDRQAEVFLERDFDGSILDSPKVTLVEGDTTIEDLNIDPVLFSDIKNNTTLIIHNAWNVNLFARFKSFRPNIQSVRTLVDIALGSPRSNPPRIIFTSSVTVFKNWNARYGRPLEAKIEDPTIALGCGYGESKLVAERILENAARSTPLCPIIVRIAQLAGAPNGTWSATDWVPIFVMCGQVLGAFPTRNDCVTWLSPQIAAEALFDFRNSESQYLHLTHPKPVPWASVVGVFASRLGIPLVGWNEWVLRGEQRFAGLPVYRFVDIFHNWNRPVALEHREAPGMPMMDMRQALNCSPSLTHSSLPQLTPQDAERWISYWRRVGTISSSGAKL